MAPLVRRTLAPKGKTPQLLHTIKHRSRSRDKVSVIAALTISPKSQRLGLYFSNLINDYFDSFTVAFFLRELLKHLRGPVIVVWDGGPMHQGPDIRKLQEDFPRLQFERLPPYAPDLNPVECVWSYVKWGRLCNYSPSSSEELGAKLVDELHSIRTDQQLLRGFWQGSDLPLPRAFFT